MTKPTIHEALSAVMAEVQAVGKGDRNTAQGYQFRGIDAVVNAVGPVLRKHGVIAVPHQTEARYRDVQTSNGKASRECTVNVTYRFYGPAGDFIDANVPGESMDFGDKGAPKAMSVAYRIALLQALCIPTDEPDPDAQSFDRGSSAVSPNDIRDAALAANGNREKLLPLYHQAQRLGYVDEPVKNETGELEGLGALITRLGQEPA